MKFKTITALTWMICFLIPFTAFGLTVTAHVDKNRITRDDAVFLQVEVDESSADIDISVIQDFKVVKRGSSSMTRIINGSMERKMTYQYMLIPLRDGELTIPPIPAKHKNQTTRSDPITIKVSKGQVVQGGTKPFFIKVELAYDHVFPGQQTVYTLKFYNSEQITGLGFESPPGFGKLSVKPFDKQKSYTQRINGILYRVTQVNYLVSPAEPGTYKIGPAVLVAAKVVENQPGSGFDQFFNDPFFNRRQTRPVRVSSEPLTLTVVPLPPYHGQETFSGLIGRFELDSQADKTTLKAGESVTLTIKISGSGNIMDAGQPDLELDPNTFKVYDDNPKDSIQMTETGYAGQKVFKKAIVPVKPGEYKIAAMHLTYFDLDLQDYHTIATSPVDLHVKVSPKMLVTQAAEPIVQKPSAGKKKVDLMNRDILEIKEGMSVMEDIRPMKPFIFLVWVLVPGLMFLSLAMVRRVKGKAVPHEKQMREKAKNCLNQALKNQSSDSQFFSRLYDFVIALVLSKSDQKAESLTTREAADILESKGVDPVDIEKVACLIRDIEAARFGGKSCNEKEKSRMSGMAKQLLKKLCVFLMVGCLWTAVPSRAMAGPSAMYLDAVKSYHSGEFQKAAHEFEKIAKIPVKNPKLYYNIGNAYLKAGDVGRAVLWYERAKKLSPNDPDLKYNLAYANSRVKDEVEKTVSLGDIFFFWDSIVSIKILQIISIAMSALFFAWAAFRFYRRKSIFSGTGSAIFGLFLLITILTGISMVRQSYSNQAVILDNNVVVRSGTAPDATPLFTLNAGTKVRVEEQKNKYYKIVLSKEKIGWVQIAHARLI